MMYRRLLPAPADPSASRVHVSLHDGYALEFFQIILRPFLDKSDRLDSPEMVEKALSNILSTANATWVLALVEDSASAFPLEGSIVYVENRQVGFRLTECTIESLIQCYKKRHYIHEGGSQDDFGTILSRHVYYTSFIALGTLEKGGGGALSEDYSVEVRSNIDKLMEGLARTSTPVPRKYHRLIPRAPAASNQPSRCEASSSSAAELKLGHYENPQWTSLLSSYHNLPQEMLSDGVIELPGIPALPGILAHGRHDYGGKVIEQPLGDIWQLEPINDMPAPHTVIQTSTGGDEIFRWRQGVFFF